MRYERLYKLIDKINNMGTNNKKQQYKQKVVEMDLVARQIIKWQKQDSNKRACIVLAWDTEVGDCVIAEGGIEQDLTILLAKAMESNDDFRRQSKLALLVSALRGLSDDNE